MIAYTNQWVFVTLITFSLKNIFIITKDFSIFIKKKTISNILECVSIQIDSNNNIMEAIKLPAWIPKLSFEKKETFLKLTILTCAAILCNKSFIYLFFFLMV